MRPLVASLLVVPLLAASRANACECEAPPCVPCRPLAPETEPPPAAACPPPLAPPSIPRLPYRPSLTSAHEAPRRHHGLMVAGLNVFGAVWTASSVIAVLGDEPLLALPIFGPLALAVEAHLERGFLGGIVVISNSVITVVQAAGLIMTVVGAVTRRAPRTIVAPSFTAHGAGFALSGRF